MDKKTAIRRVLISFAFFALASALFGHYADYSPICGLAGMYGFLVFIVLAAYYYRDSKYTETELWAAAGYGLTVFFSFAAFLAFERAIIPPLFASMYAVMNGWLLGWSIFLGVVIAVLSFITGKVSEPDKKDKPKKDSEKVDSVIIAARDKFNSSKKEMEESLKVLRENGVEIVKSDKKGGGKKEDDSEPKESSKK